MVTKFNTGDMIMIPARITSARESNGVVLYDVEYTWEPVREDQVVPAPEAVTQEAFDRLREGLIGF